MPRIGSIKPDREIGKGQKGSRYIYVACPNCNTTRWVRFLRGKPETTRCYDCAIKQVGIQNRGQNNPNWRGGKQKNSTDYISVKLQSEDDFFRPMTSKTGYVAEHRLIMAKHISRCLLSWEVVHHKNGIRNDNRLENLRLVASGRCHISDSLLKAENKRLRNEVATLRAKVVLLERGCVL